LSRLTRAQVLTSSSNNRRVEYFSDFNTNFSLTPVGDQLARVTNDKSIIQSLRNLIFTRPGERLFNPNFGCYLTDLLFEHNLPEVITIGEKYVRDAIEEYEPRVELLQVSISSSETNVHEAYITLRFRTINNEEPKTVTFLLKRVR
jgi:phage baseplate assembly protein W